MPPEPSRIRMLVKIRRLEYYSCGILLGNRFVEHVVQLCGLCDRLVVAAPDDDRRVVVEEINHIPYLPDGLIDEFRRIDIFPLERKILPDHYAGFVQRVVELFAVHVGVHAHSVAVGFFDQLHVFFNPVRRVCRKIFFRYDIGASHKDPFPVYYPGLVLPYPYVAYAEPASGLGEFFPGSCVKQHSPGFIKVLVPHLSRPPQEREAERGLYVKSVYPCPYLKRRLEHIRRLAVRPGYFHDS